MQDYTNQIQEFVQNSPALSYKIFLTVAVIFVIWALRLMAIRIVNRQLPEAEDQYRWRKNLTYISVFLGFLIVGRIWFEGLQSIATFLGLLSAGLAIALRDPVSDLAGWLFILWRKPFEVGDRIQLGDVKGDVIDTRIFKFTVLEIGNWVRSDQSTGRVVHVPNHEVFNEPLANYTSDFEFIWNEMQVLVTFESDWSKAKKLLQDIADKHLNQFADEAQRQVQRAQKAYLIHYRHLTPIVYTDVQDSGICLTIRHLTNPRRRRSTSEALWEDILNTFDQHDDIDLAYPTMRIYKEPNTGKDKD